MSRTKVGVLVTAGLTLVYIGLLGNSAVKFIQSGQSIGMIMGVTLLVFPLIGAALVLIELRFGFRIEKLAARLEVEGAWPKFEFELRPSGRPVRASAQREFEKYKAAAEASPEDWRAWFSLGLVYDAAGDRSRARAAMRKALAFSE
jgi:tetratricopeptide (TPR) repeat protein